MPVLPIVLEQSARWYSFAGPIAGILLLVAGTALWFAWRRGLSNMKSSNFVALVATVLIAAWALVFPLGWELRLDKDGISFSAPFDPMASTGRIPWRDLKDARFGTRDAGVPTLEFVGGGSQKLVLDTLEEVPPAFWAALVAVVEANAPGFRFQPTAEAWLAQARQKSTPAGAPMMLQGYVARDGAGNALK
jgi:hypothetical protein